MTRTVDHHRRALNAVERAELDRLRPALEAWRDYLDRVPARASFLAAEEAQAPIIARHTPARALPGRNPLVVNPRYALDWARANGLGGRIGTGSPLSYSTMVSALDFMGATQAETFRARVDSCERRRRPGYFHLTVELVDRIRGSNFTPVLMRRPGRPRTSDRPPTAPRARAIRRADGDDSLTIVRHWLQVTEPTALLGRARDEGRPLAVRPAGRPAQSMHRGAQVVRTHLLGRTEMLHAHALEFGKWRLPSVPELGAALRAHATATPDAVSPVSRFSTPDAERRRNLRGWWRFTLSAFGRPALEPADLAGEVEYFYATQRRLTTPEPVVEPTRDYHGLTLPAGCDPQWLGDPDYRLMHEITDEQYEAWKAGL